jgi:hypothetical protein
MQSVNFFIESVLFDNVCTSYDNRNVIEIGLMFGRFPAVLVFLSRFPANPTSNNHPLTNHNLRKISSRYIPTKMTICIDGHATMKQARKYYKEDTSPPPKGGEWVVEEPDFDEIRRCIGKSFAGSETVPGEPMFDWATNHVDEEWYTREEHQNQSVNIYMYDLSSILLLLYK